MNKIIGGNLAPASAQGQPQVRSVVVDEESAGQRLDNFLIRHLKGVPKTHVYRIIRSGEVRVNKGRASADTRLELGDEVRVPPLRLAEKDEVKAAARDKLAGRLKWVDGELAGKQYLMGDQFTVADGYLFTVTNWTQPTKLDISGLANLAAYRERVGARPAVQAAMKAEGLLK